MLYELHVLVQGIFSYCNVLQCRSTEESGNGGNDADEGIERSSSMSIEAVTPEELGTHASSSSSVTAITPCTTSEVDHLISMFEETFEEKQILAIYIISGKKYDLSLQCLLEGCNLKAILSLIKSDFEERPVARLNLDESSVWSDMLTYYKSGRPVDVQIRVIQANSIAVDTGGIRRQAYSTVFYKFAENRYIHIFDGDNTSRLRPATSAIARSSGLLVLLGKMISHAIYQDGIGFPYLSPACYYYLIGSEDMAIPHIYFSGSRGLTERLSCIGKSGNSYFSTCIYTSSRNFKLD